ncbi:MAG: sugar phosphate isomerase/epimerase [Planctomycetia bacterium]|nr:sugar phosphate isomerase/epimerase [Planctomycetia bacterium]
MTLSRRNFMQMGLGAAALLASGIQVKAYDCDKSKPLCLQMYTVGGYFRKDPEGTMAKVAEMGYKGIDYAGYPLPVAELRKLQDKYGLFCLGTHTGRGAIENLDNLKRTIEDHLTLGAKYIICPGMHNDGEAGWTEAAKKFSAASAIAREAGLYVGYHAHQHDFNVVTEDGRSSWEVFADNSDKEVMMQIDMGHCVNKGADYAKLIKKYPGRSKTVHVKESDGLVLGDPKGRVDWQLTFELLETIGGVEAYTLEYEAGVDRLQAAKMSMEAWKRIHG